VLNPGSFPQLVGDTLFVARGGKWHACRDLASCGEASLVSLIESVTEEPVSASGLVARADAPEVAEACVAEFVRSGKNWSRQNVICAAGVQRPRFSSSLKLCIETLDGERLFVRSKTDDPWRESSDKCEPARQQEKSQTSGLCRESGPGGAAATVYRDRVEIEYRGKRRAIMGAREPIWDNLVRDSPTLYFRQDGGPHFIYADKTAIGTHPIGPLLEGESLVPAAVGCRATYDHTSGYFVMTIRKRASKGGGITVSRFRPAALLGGPASSAPGAWTWKRWIQ
jgi:hypothetical protein